MFPFEPIVTKEANCGPTALATVLEIPTDKAICLMDKQYKKGWHGYTNVGHIKAALESKGYQMKKIKEYSGIRDLKKLALNRRPVLLFIQLEGPWMGKGWRNEYNHTHWAYYHHDNMMDVNNFFSERQTKPKWIPTIKWENIVMPFIMREGKSNGWHVKGAYEIVPKTQRRKQR